MVYINIKDEAPVVYLPLNGWDGSLSNLVVLTVENTTDHRVLSVGMEDVHKRGFMVRVAVTLPEGFYAGEWQYTLGDGEVTVATGLLVAYDGERQGAVQYQSENNVIQYGG